MSVVEVEMVVRMILPFRPSPPLRHNHIPLQFSPSISPCCLQNQFPDLLIVLADDVVFIVKVDALDPSMAAKLDSVLVKGESRTTTCNGE